MNNTLNKRALIYDEAGFSRVCSAILEIGGCDADVMDEMRDLPERLDRSNVGVVITSYPYGEFILDEVRDRNIPAIVLFDNFDERFISVLQEYANSYCMIKPLDYEKFQDLVKLLLGGKWVSREDYSVV